jgi:tetratricopeptide (TPR) repeat protein
MKDNFTTEDLILFLDGEMPPETATELQLKLNTDADLSSRFRRLQVSRDAIKLSGTTTKVSEIHRQMMREMQPQQLNKPAAVLRLFKPLLRIAAVLFLFLGCATVYLYTNLTPNRQYMANYQAYYIGESRGAAEDQLEKAWRNGESANLISSFEKIGKPTASDRFYAANAYLQLNQPAAAIQQFRLVQAMNEATGPTVFEEDTDYFLAMAYLRNNQSKEAVLLFEKINQTPDHVYHRKVSNWLLWKLKHLHS